MLDLSDTKNDGLCMSGNHLLCFQLPSQSLHSDLSRSANTVSEYFRLSPVLYEWIVQGNQVKN